MIDLERAIDDVPRYDPVSCPDGMLDLAGAENYLMEDVTKAAIDEFMEGYSMYQGWSHGRTLMACQTLLAPEYGPVVGPPELAAGVSKFMNRHFNPATAIQPSQVFVTAGVTSLIDIMAFNMCDEGEGIMLLTPTYSMFQIDLSGRSRLKVVMVSTGDISNQFSSDYCGELMQRCEQELTKSEQRGVKVKAFLLCNPSNPVGRCYSPESLTALARFCGRHRLHLLSDEIYALSCFPSPGRGMDTFTSILTLKEDPANDVYMDNIHCMYGASKDFGYGGLRLGFLVTRNPVLWNTCRRMALLNWVPRFSGDFFSHFINDTDRVDQFIRLYKERLASSYSAVTSLLARAEIPFIPANSGVFFLVDLSSWLQYFPGYDPEESREKKLCLYLAREAGVFLSYGELSVSPIAGTFRLTHTLPLVQMQLAVRRLKAGLGRLDSTGRVYPPVDLTQTEASDGASMDTERWKGTTTADKTEKGGPWRRVKSLLCFD
ncbi:PLP-dependent transferase [Thozetella sp. PMI_491]|nr:PLP-dependent transferase [Thozetella sp. PMI_491]